MKKRVIGTALTAVLASASLVACSSGGGNGEGAAENGDGAKQLTVYYGTPRDIIAPLFDGFRAAHPDIEVNEFRQPTEELMSTLQLEVQAGNQRADAVISATAQLMALHADTEAFQPYESEHSGALVETLRDPESLVNPLGVNLYMIAYNSSSISEDEAPKSFAELLDPRWDGLISLADPDNSASIHSFIWHMSQYLDDQGAPYGWGFFEELGKLNPRLESSHGTIRDLVLSGERPVGLLLTEHIPALDADPAGAWMWPTETMPAEPLGVGVLKNSANTEAAQLFVDYIHSVEGQELIADSLGLSPVRTDVDFAFADGATLADHEVVAVDSGFISQNRQEQADEFHARMGTR